MRTRWLLALRELCPGQDGADDLAAVDAQAASQVIKEDGGRRPRNLAIPYRAPPAVDAGVYRRNLKNWRPVVIGIVTMLFVPDTDAALVNAVQVAAARLPFDSSVKPVAETG